jgi:DNA-binding CsgD family transcriptional regulator
MTHPISAELAQFGARTASFVSEVLGADWSCFYHLDERCQPFGFQAHRTPWALRQSYLERDIARTDVLHPASLVRQNVRFVSMSDPRLLCPVESRRNLWSFLSSFGTRDAAEMIFRVDGRAVAGLSLLWVGDTESRAERQRGEAVQSYVEFNLSPHYRSGASNEAIPLVFTDRELQIVQLVCHGLTNAQIAQRLRIGVATIKTHLLHVFEKQGVHTRAGLVSRFLSDRPRA